VRTLPEKASLRYLRQEAKDLLVALRESHPTASLADAQRSLAEQYGFRTWPDLKAEVDIRRRSDATADPETARELAGAFGLGAVAGAMVLVSSDFMGGTWRLPTESGLWSMRPVFDWMGDRHAAIAVGLMEAASAAGIRTPVAVRSSQGHLLEEVAGRKWRADEWMQLGHSPVKPVSARIAAAVGGVLATVHALALPAPAGSESPPGRRLTTQEWEGLLTAARARRARWAPALERAIPSLVELGSVPRPAPAEPPILSHRDLTPTTVRVDDGELVVLHWEFAGGQSPRQELGNTISQWAFGAVEGVNESAARAMFEAYTAKAGPVAPDLSMFSESISSHLWWMSGRVHNALVATSREQQRFAERELRELFAHPRTRASYELIVDPLSRADTAGVAR
jgi:hypothetical protein